MKSNVHLLTLGEKTLNSFRVRDRVKDRIRIGLGIGLPKNVNQQKTLDGFKIALGTFLKQFPDTPPVRGYTTANTNSLLDWSRDRGTPLGGRT